MVHRVPEVGRVIDVFPVVLNVTVSVPVPITVFPDTVIVFPVFATPVPPYAPAITSACHVPVPNVPTLVRDELTIFVPRVVELSTLVPLIWKSLPVDRFRVPVIEVFPLILVGSDNVIDPLPLSCTMFPVVLPPRVNVWFLRVWILPLAGSR